MEAIRQRIVNCQLPMTVVRGSCACVVALKGRDNVAQGVEAKLQALGFLLEGAKDDSRQSL